MPQVDHRISQSFKCVVQLAQAFEPQQQTPELILPSEHALDGVETLFKNGGVEQRLAATLGYLRIPTQAGRGYRFEAGQGSDLMPATVPR